MSRISISIVSRTPDVSSHRALWEDLYRGSMCEPSTSFEWTHALTRSHVGSRDGFVLLRASRGSEIIGLLPMVTRRVAVLGCPVVILSPLSEFYNTHSDFLTSHLDEDLTSALIAALFGLEERWDIFRMSKVLADHPLLGQMQRFANGRQARIQVRDGQASYHLALPIRYEDYLAGRSAKFRNYLKRSAKKISQLDDPQVVEVSDASDVADACDMLMQVEHASWKHAHGTAISAVARQAQFYRELCEGAAASGRLHLQFLRVGGSPAAYNLGYVANGCYSYLKTSFDERYRQCGAATYLRGRLIESLIARGVRHMDFPAEPYEWESQWTDSVRWHKVLTVYGMTAVGRVLAGVDRLRQYYPTSPRLQHVDPRALRPAKRASEQA